MLNQRYLSLLTCILALILSGCNQHPQLMPKMSGDQRANYLLALNDWQARGRLGVKDQNQGHNVSIEWRQQGPDYELFIFSPLSSDSARISGRPGEVSLTTSDDQAYHSNDVDALILEHLGWHFPFNNLQYWVKGLPVPDTDSSNIKYDRFGQLQSIEQDGWHIDYHSYVVEPPITLPTRITLTKGDIKLKLAIKDWQR